MSDKVYQRKNGSFYVNPEEFVESDEGQDLLQRFIDARSEVLETEERQPETENKKREEVPEN